MQKLDLRKENGVAYSDFLIATLDFSKLLTTQKLAKIFQLIDKDNDGFISVKDLYLFSSKELMMEQCQSLLRECVLLINDCFPDQMKQIGGSGDAEQALENVRLSFTQFKNIVLNQNIARKENDAATSGQPKTTNTQPLIANYGGQGTAQGGAGIQSNVLVKVESRNIYPKISIDFFGNNVQQKNPANLSIESIGAGQ